MKQFLCTFGFMTVGTITTMGLYSYTKDYYRKNYKKYSHLKDPTTRELMAVGGVTSIVGLALSLVNKHSLYKMIEYKKEE